MARTRSEGDSSVHDLANDAEFLDFLSNNPDQKIIDQVRAGNEEAIAKAREKFEIFQESSEAIYEAAGQGIAKEYGLDLEGDSAEAIRDYIHDLAHDNPALYEKLAKSALKHQKTAEKVSEEKDMIESLLGKHGMGLDEFAVSSEAGENKSHDVFEGYGDKDGEHGSKRAWGMLKTFWPNRWGGQSIGKIWEQYKDHAEFRNDASKALAAIKGGRLWGKGTVEMENDMSELRQGLMQALKKNDGIKNALKASVEENLLARIKDGDSVDMEDLPNIQKRLETMKSRTGDIFEFGKELDPSAMKKQLEDSVRERIGAIFKEGDKDAYKTKDALKEKRLGNIFRSAKIGDASTKKLITECIDAETSDIENSYSGKPLEKRKLLVLAALRKDAQAIKG